MIAMRNVIGCKIMLMVVIYLVFMYIRLINVVSKGS